MVCHQSHEQTHGYEPPKPWETTRFGAARPKFLLDKFVVIKLVIRQAQIRGVRGLRPTRAFVRTAFGAGRRVPGHVGSTVGTNLGRHIETQGADGEET